MRSFLGRGFSNLNLDLYKVLGVKNAASNQEIKKVTVYSQNNILEKGFYFWPNER